MPNFNLSVNASQRKISQVFHQKQKHSTFPLKKARQSQNERLQTHALFSLPDTASISTPDTLQKDTNWCPKLKKSGTLALSMTFLLLLANFRSANAIENGTLVDNGIVNDLHPLVRQNKFNKTLSVCSSVKLNNHQVLTARHCEFIKYPLGGQTYRIQADLCVEGKAGRCIPVSKMVKHHRIDMAILTTESPFSNGYACPPRLMGHLAHKRHSRSNFNSTNPCGGHAPHLIFARGAKNDTIEGARDHSLSLGEFAGHQKDRYISNWQNLQLESRRGVKNAKGIGAKGIGNKDTSNEGIRAIAAPGDSGGGVYTCNPLNRKYELSGLVQGGRINSDICFVTKTATRTTLAWIRRHHNPCDEKPTNLAKTLFGNNE